MSPVVSAARSARWWCALWCAAFSAVFPVGRDVSAPCLLRGMGRNFAGPCSDLAQRLLQADMAGKAACALYILAALDRMGEFHCRIILETLEQGLQARIV